jgi:uncharacterized protein YegP (UPF0339 family)
MVITPTTGKDTVMKAIESVAQQTVPTEHLIVEDGKDVATKGLWRFELGLSNAEIITLPENVGRYAITGKCRLHLVLG